MASTLSFVIHATVVTDRVGKSAFGEGITLTYPIVEILYIQAIVPL